MARSNNTQVKVGGNVVELNKNLLNKIENFGLDEGLIELVEYLEYQYLLHSNVITVLMMLESKREVWIYVL